MNHENNNIPSGNANKLNELKEYDFVDALNVFQSSRDMLTPQKYFTFFSTHLKN